MMRSVVLVVGACAAAAMMVPVDASAQGRKGTQAMELDPGSRGAVSGIGIESRDIDAMADLVVRDVLTRPDILGTGAPPRIVVDSEKFFNNSAQRIDRDMITSALRASLSRAAAGRLRFVSRESMDIVMRERELKRSGTADVGTRGLTRAVSGLDYQLIGRMTSLDSRDMGKSGLTQRRTQVIFELVDMETGDLPWTSEPYVILRAAGIGVQYR